MLIRQTPNCLLILITENVFFFTTWQILVVKCMYDDQVNSIGYAAVQYILHRPSEPPNFTQQETSWERSREIPHLFCRKKSVPVFTGTRHWLFMIHFSSTVQPCAEAQIRFQLNRCWMWGWQSDTWTQFYPTTTLSSFAQCSILIHSSITDAIKSWRLTKSLDKQLEYHTPTTSISTKWSLLSCLYFSYSCSHLS